MKKESPKTAILKIQIKSKILLGYHLSGDFYQVNVKTFTEANKLLQPFFILNAPRLSTHITLFFKDGKEFDFSISSEDEYSTIEDWLQGHFRFVKTFSDVNPEWTKEKETYEQLFKRYFIGDVPKVINLKEVSLNGNIN